MKYIKQEKTTHCQNLKNLTEPDSDMTKRFNLTHRVLKITMISMQKALLEKVKNMQDQMSDSRNTKNYEK